MGSVPAKWRKYLLLKSFSLTSDEVLQDQIQRYSWGNRQLLIDALDGQMCNNMPAENHMYVVKFVPLELSGQLPNIRLTHHGDLVKLRNEIGRVKREYVEIWCCRTSVSYESLSCAGRLMHTPALFPEMQVIEQVWNTSPRLIEQFGAGFQYPYARASRLNWAWRYKLNELFVPDLWTVSRDKLIVELIYSLQLLEGIRERLELLFAFFDSANVASYSVEYKLVGSTLTIIDWDSSDDSRILKYSNL